MSTIEEKISSSPEVMAQKVLIDIRDRGLVSGDRYLTAEEARSTFRVGKSLINDALKLLADRQILVRKRRAGTYIGPRFSVEENGEEGGSSTRDSLSVIHVLIPMDYYRANVIPGTTFVESLSRVVPGASIQLHHIADEKTTEYTAELISSIKMKRTRREGLVLLRSTREAQIAVQDSGIPAVVFGSTYPDVKTLACIDPDQEQTGMLAAQAALERGHTRFALIMRNYWRRGDNLLMEGFSQVLGEAGIGIDRVRVLSTPEDAAIIGHDVAALLEQEPHPTALICRSRFHAEAAIRGIRERGLEPGKDVLVISTQSGTLVDASSSLSIVPVMSGPEMVSKVGELLLEIAEQGKGKDIRRRIAVKAIASPAEGGQAA